MERTIFTVSLGYSDMKLSLGCIQETVELRPSLLRLGKLLLTQGAYERGSAEEWSRKLCERMKPYIVSPSRNEPRQNLR